ncbi:MAG: hypothetical protein KC636_38040 [Myxococcales bacterium]|nr:hypothetical protein [Myxococcales bacterium]
MAALESTWRAALLLALVPGCQDQIIGALPTSDATLDTSVTAGDATGEAESETAIDATTDATTDTTAGTEEPTGPAPTFVAVGQVSRRLVSSDGGSTWPIDLMGVEGDPEEVLTSVTFGEDRFVAVGGLDFGRSMVSDDGATWSEHEDGLPQLRDVVYGSGMFVAVGWSGRRAWSWDGLSWNDIPVEEPGDLFESIAYGDGVFVATGWGGLRLRTIDAQQWTNRVTDLGDGLTDVVYGNGRFVAIGRNDGRVVVSEDGVDWTGEAELGARGKGLCFGDGRFLALGDMRAHLSVDGLAWESYDVAPTLERCAWGDGVFVATEPQDRRWRSTDGIDWEPVDVAAPVGPGLADIAFGPVLAP